MRLKDSVAVVTGGGGGLGEAICLALAREGASVVVSDAKLELAEAAASKVRETGRKALANRTDVRSANQVQALIETTLKEMGQLDILVCSAGVLGLGDWKESGGRPTLETTTEEVWDLTLDVNLKGVFLCNRAVAPHFKAQKSGKIINIASIAGRRVVEGNSINPQYCASKAGVISLTQAVALQLAPYGVNVNSVCPGDIYTPLWADYGQMLADTQPAHKGMSPHEVFQSLQKSMYPLSRPTTPEDVGDLVVFLASDEAKAITGQAVNVDGGFVLS